MVATNAARASSHISKVDTVPRPRNAAREWLLAFCVAQTGSPMIHDVAKNTPTIVSPFGITERDVLRREREEKLRQNGQIQFLAQNKKNRNFGFHMFSKGSYHIS